MLCREKSMRQDSETLVELDELIHARPKEISTKEIT
jgi:hypothetical protein